ncbi:hypothetical protein SLA2020_359150 [Shorea laevis]
MAIPHEKLASFSENSQLEDSGDVEDYEEMSTYSSCGCFRGLCFRYGTRRYVLRQQRAGEKEENWLVNKMRQVKQLPEVLGRPKWKKFIRCTFGVHGLINKKRRMQFQYDPRSYALNFDDGIHR